MRPCYSLSKVAKHSHFNLSSLKNLNEHVNKCLYDDFIPGRSVLKYLLIFNRFVLEYVRLSFLSSITFKQDMNWPELSIIFLLAAAWLLQ